ncbi:hypothetical protein FQN54_002521 [Arachnomyces sp. PD_36]|nr:hypothetical protein FQN54_002521 [Arachnomyces sp. PD_36]
MATPETHVPNLHSAEPGAPVTPLRRRACDRCRQRKSRCDGGDTCTVCPRAGVSCQYLTASTKREPRPQYPGGRKALLQLPQGCPAGPYLFAGLPDDLDPGHSRFSTIAASCYVHLQTFLISHGNQIMPPNMPGTGDARMDETQRLDILVTQSWVRMLVWELGHRLGLLRDEPPTSSTRNLADIDIVSSKYLLRISQKLLNVNLGANKESLEAHGIGIEQKTFDVASTLSDVLRCSSDWGSDMHALGHGSLQRFMGLPVNFRNRESQYLQPLRAKARDVLDVTALFSRFFSMVGESEDAAEVVVSQPRR